MNRAWLNSLLMYVWLTIGYSIAHVVMSLWVISLYHAISPDTRPNEDIQFTEDGEALIQSYGVGDGPTFRRLDGTVITDVLGLGSKFAGQPLDLAHSVHAEPRSWEYRMTPFHDFQRPATCWYFIVPPNQKHLAYFVGYDERSRHLVGYLGMNGFSQQIPTADQSFPIETSEYDAFSGVLTSAQAPNHHPAIELGEWVELNDVPKTNADADTVWILSQGNIYEIHLRTRQVRTMVQNQTDYKELNGMTTTRDEKLSMHLLVRTETQLINIDPSSGKSVSWEVDPVPPNSYDSFYQLKNGKQILVDRSYSRNPRQEKDHLRIRWLGANGEIERTAETELFSYRVDSFAGVFGISLSFPLPIASFGTWLIGPLVVPQEFSDSQSSAGIHAQFFSDFKWWLIISSLIGIGTGWACWRRERDVFGMKSWFWPILVGACGMFGWMGYICMRPLPARLPNREWLPSSPEPARPIGTEIFA